MFPTYNSFVVCELEYQFTIYYLCNFNVMLSDFTLQNET